MRNHTHKHVPVTFNLKTKTRIKLTDDEIRLMVAFYADGSYGRRDLSKIGPNRKGCIRIKKEVKKIRLRKLLKSVGITWTEKPAADNFSVFSFMPPLHGSKTYGSVWWGASYKQRLVIADEVSNWDGRVLKHKHGAKSYSSIHKSDADFIQFCFVSTGQRASRKPLGADGTYGVHATGNGRTNSLAMLPKPRKYKKRHDGFMYSFSVPSTYLVLRRNGKVFVTGNTGKSKCIIDEWGAAVEADELDDLLIIAPAGSYRGWDLPGGGELVKHLPVTFKHTTATWISSKRAARSDCEEMVNDGASSFPRVFLVNIEALSSVSAVFDLCERFLSQRRCMMVVDESTTLRNPGSMRTKRILLLGPKAKRRRIMTGLVSPKSPLDLWAQFAFLDWRILGHQSYITFRSRYAIVKKVCMLPTRELASRLTRVAGASWMVPGVGRIDASDLNRDGLLAELERRRIFVPTIPKIEGYRHEDELRAKIAPYSFRVTLNDVRAASPPVYVIREVELSAEQKRIYVEVRDFATAEVEAGKHVTALAVIAQILRLHQIVCGFTVDDTTGEILDLPQRRIDALLGVLAEYDGKAIIWVSYDRDIGKVVAALEDEYGPGCVARFWGGNRPTREDEEARFKADPQCRFLVATAAAGGRGRTWSMADLAVFYSNDFDLEHRMQAEERTEGVDKFTGATRVDLVARGTVDEKIIQALRNKIDLASAVTGDAWRQWLV